MSLNPPKIQFATGLGMLLVTCLSHVSLFAQQRDSTRTDTATTTRPRNLNPYRPSFRLNDRYGDPFSNYSTQSPFYLKDPKGLNLGIELDTGMNYTISEKMGKVNYRPTTSMSFNEFGQQQNRLMLKDYWHGRSKALDGESAVSSRNLIPKLFVSPVIDRIFGGSYVELIPRGFVTLDFGAQFQKIENPSIPIRQQKNGGFEFDQQINLNVTGKIGEKMRVTTNFDNSSSFDFQSNFKVEYTGFKEDILKKLELGNVSLPLNNSLITGAQNLFGIKAQMQFGKLFVTSIATTQRGKQSSIEIQGNASGTTQGRAFEFIASNYDDNRHFFLSQFFRDNFEGWLSTLPQITSGVNVTRVEVYLLNRNNDTQTLRNIVGFMDMGETDKIYRKDLLTQDNKVSDKSPTANGNNDLFTRYLNSIDRRADTISYTLEKQYNFKGGLDFEKVTSSRKLATSEYTFHKELGYITLQRKLQGDEAIAVAFEYTYNGRVYKVGELSEDYSNLSEDKVIFLKLLRPRTGNSNIKDASGKTIPTWNLMMKNVYNLNVNALSREGFQLRVIYRDDKTGIDNPQLQEGEVARTKQLIEVFGLDRLNPYNDPQPDGNFDFVDKVTVIPETGLIIFPYLEPFNKGLRNLFNLETNPNTKDYLVNKYVYDTLYHTTKAQAELVAAKNKFYLVGSYRSGSGKEIPIPGFNISQGSVKVYAGGTPLREGSDYTVDYTFGKVTILNEGILTSGKNISITYEQQDPFAFQTRSLLGSRFDYKVNDDINIGSTLLYYNERPVITRNAIGNEPARNLQYGVDVNIKKNSRLLTKMVDALPFIQTKETSTINLNAEFAQLLPGTSNKINGEGTSFLDDFENSATPYSLITPANWKLAAIPNDPRFDPTNGAPVNLQAGYKRAKLAWYQVDNIFYRSGTSYAPKSIDRENHYVRPIQPQEIFPNFDNYIGNFYEPIFDIAYYPTERGQYNFNPDLNADGTLKNPATNWAGITTAIKTEVDFDKANIEYIEFWMMNPFITTEKGKIMDGSFNQNNTTGGKMELHLGSISEDIMRDAKHAFENGLPTGDNIGTGTVANAWGYVTTQQYLNNAFDNSSSSRPRQDVGLDGLNNAGEETYFKDFMSTVTPAAKEIVRNDPAADDFQYFLGGDLDSKNAEILQRYKNFNGMENNSPVLSGSDPYTKSGTTIPDNEDLNLDNTLSDLEQYYSYNIELSPSQLEVGKKYIVDKIVPSAHSDVTWYLFRVPVRQYDGKVGDINDFKSIRYARLILNGFTQPVVLRLAKFRAIGNKWRRYTDNLEESKFGELLEPNFDNFTVSTVNVEENGKENNIKPAYVPPLNRDRDVTSTVARRLNEQSVQLCASDLAAGDARAIYKNVTADLFNYGRIKMFLSAYKQNVTEQISDGQLTAFLRLGSDFDQNFYEIEIPLRLTPNGTKENYGDLIWPEENQIDLDLNELYALKVQRDRDSYPLSQQYPQSGAKQVDGKHGIRILGRPDLSQVKVLMIGVRNPRSKNTKPVSVCIWADELRLTDFDRSAGWAANAVLNAKLADLGTVTGSVRHIGFGYGGVQSKISERARGETTSYDVSANINVDKLLPKQLGLKIPMFASYENSTINPKYDPANPDVRIDAALKSFTSDADKQAYLSIIRDVTERRSLNFTNVRRVKTNPKAVSHIYDIENFSFSYAYSEATQTNFNLIDNTRRSIKGSSAWQYNPKFKGFEPFKNAKAFSSPFLQLIKDLNFNPVPTNISVRGELDRSFSKLVYRNSVKDQVSSAPNYSKYFVFNRYYNARWSLSKALTIDYSSRVNAIIDEPDGDIDTKEKQDSIKANLRRLGRMKNFDQTITANYTLPLDKLPITNWVSADYRYNVGYSWKAGPLEKADSLKLGNIIQNTQDQGLNGKIDMLKLYNKVGFLKNINTPKRTPTPLEKARKPTGPDTVKRPPDLGALKGLLRLIMSIRSVSGTYTLTQGTILPGFTETPYLMGMSKGWVAPGWNFVLGGQDPNIRYKAAQNGWLSVSNKLTTPFSQVQTRDLSARASIEPSSDFKIQLDLKKTATTSFQEIYRFNADSGRYTSLSPSRNGSYKISIVSIKTAFKNNTSTNSTVFQQFTENITIMKDRFNALPQGKGSYEKQSQDVLIPAFISAYTDKNAQSASLSPFPNIPVPNWRVDYNGLNKLDLFKDIFQSITLNHSYSSSYQVMSYTNSLNYKNVSIDQPIEQYNNGYFAQSIDNQLVPIYVISQVMISEQFSPLFGINLRTKNKLNIRFDYKTKRDLSLNISNAQVTELNSKDWSVQLGYTKNNMKLPFKDQGRVITLKNDVTFTLNVSVTNNRTIQRKIDEVNTITNGNINFQLRPNVQYVINQKLNIQIYMDRNVNEPLVTNSYRRATTKAGVKLVYNLAQ